MLETLPQEIKERIEREGSHLRLVSVLFSLAKELIESGEADEILNNKTDLKNKKLSKNLSANSGT